MCFLKNDKKTLSEYLDCFWNFFLFENKFKLLKNEYDEDVVKTFEESSKINDFNKPNQFIECFAPQT